MLKVPATFPISSAQLVSVIRVWVEEERGTGGNRGKKRRKEREKSACLSARGIWERTYCQASGSCFCCFEACLCSRVTVGCRVSACARGCGAGFHRVPTDGALLHTVGPQPASDGMPKGPAERDGERSRLFSKPSKLPGILYSMGRVVEVETLNFL